MHPPFVVGQAIGHTKNKYTDAFTSLLEALFLDFNFDEAQKHITSISEVGLVFSMRFSVIIILFARLLLTPSLLLSPSLSLLPLFAGSCPVDAPSVFIAVGRRQALVSFVRLLFPVPCSSGGRARCLVLGAQGVLACLQLCETDFFLEPLKGAVNEHARLLIFETYCRIHKRINVE